VSAGPSTRGFVTWLRRLFLGLVLVASFASLARADDVVMSPPRDVPLVLRPASVHIPPIPATYQEREQGWLTISYPPGAHERVQPLLSDADAVKAKLGDELGQSVLDHVEVRVARTTEEMGTLAPSELPPPSYASGVAYPPLKLVLLSLTAPVGAEATDLGEVFRHELVHIALEEAVAGHHIPRWFNEGFAIHESGEHPLARVRTLWDATLSKTVIPLTDLDRSFPQENYEVSIAYAESADFVRFLLRDDDRQRFASLIDRAHNGEPFDRALADAYGVDLRKLEYEWREDIAKRYSFLPVLTGGSFLWVIVIGMLGVGYYKKKKRDKATMLRWDQEDAAREAAARAAVEVEADDGRVPAGAVRAAGLPKIEHDGSWHTLH
jgi:hypothetical protein